MHGRRPELRLGRRIETKQPTELADAMATAVAFGDDFALASAQQPSQGRASQIDDEPPAPARYPTVKRDPMRCPAAFFDDDQPFKPGHRFE